VTITTQGIEEVPVLIVGAGAAGLATAALLAKYGVRSLLVEKRREVFIYPKARNLSFRSLEILRRLGVGDEVHAVADQVPSLVAKRTLNSADEEQAIDLDAIFAGLDKLSPEPPVQYCPQSRSEPILLAEARRRGAEVCYGTELDTFEMDDDGVTAVVRERDSGELRTIRTDYLVAADGVHSTVRNALGIATSGCGALPLFVVFIYFRAPSREFFAQLSDGDGVQIKSPDAPGILLGAEGALGMFITTYFPDKGESAEQFTEQRCRELLTKAIGEQIDVDVIDVVAWQPHEQVAEQFHCGRAFLVGDSAHTMPPFKAGGANTAIQSADNLAWKLAAVLRGAAGPELLETYHAERYPVGRFAARQSLSGPTMPLLRADGDRPFLPPEEECSMFSLLVGYRYRSAAVIAGGTDLVEELRAQPGTRVPHAWVQRDGERVSTLDLLSCGFTLLTEDERWQEAAASASAALDIPIAVRCIRDREWSAVTRLRPDGALLVRPDDFVGWRADELPVDPASELHQALSAILAR
jgi:putative polyketide hydroxylase